MNIDETAKVLEDVADAYESGRLEWLQGSVLKHTDEGKVTGACILGGLGLATGMDMSLYRRDAYSNDNSPYVYWSEIKDRAPNRSAMKPPQLFLDARRVLGEAIREKMTNCNWEGQTEEDAVWKFNDLGTTARQAEVIDFIKTVAKDLRNEATPDV